MTKKTTKHMRKSDYLKKQAGPSRYIEMEFLPTLKRMWKDSGLDPNKILNENDDLYETFDDYCPDVEEAKRDGYGEYKFLDAREQIFQTLSVKNALENLTMRAMSGLYIVEERRFMTADEVLLYVDWYMYAIMQVPQPKNEYEQRWFDHTRIFLQDAFLYCLAKSIYVHVYSHKNKKSKLPLRDFIHACHTQYWFNDPSKGYRPSAYHKWDNNIPKLHLMQ